MKTNQYTLKQITLNLIDGKHGGCDEEKNSGYYFISVKDFEKYKINYKNAKEISEDDFVSCNKRTKLEPGDTIYANSGDTIGKILYIDDNEFVSRTTFQKSVAILKPNTDLVLPKYLFYLMKYNTPRLRNLASGSAQKNLLLDTMKKFFVTIPDKVYQKNIIDQLEPLDELIKLNDTQLQKIDNYINKVYQYWFIQYEFPNNEGNEYKANNGEFKYDEQLKIDIPANWKVQNLFSNDLSKLIKPGINKFNGEKIYLPTGNVNGINIDNSKKVTYENRESRANMCPKKNTVWFAKMKDSVKHITIPSNCEWFENNYILSTGFAGLECNDNNYAYIHSYINNPKFENNKNLLAHGATQQAVNNEDLKLMYILIPDNDTLSKYSNKINNLLELRMNLINMNFELEIYQTALLNKLFQEVDKNE